MGSGPGNLTEPADCSCLSPGAPFDPGAPSRVVGVDETAGRFADVAVYRCPACARLWLSYQVEYEAVGGSGRWARGAISPEVAATVTPQDAPAVLAALPGYIFGGSYFGGTARVGSGPMPW